MGKTQTLDIDVPEVTLEDIFKVAGIDYTKRPTLSSTVELHKRMLSEAYELVLPTAVWREVKIVGKDEQKLYLEGGYNLTSKLLVKVAGTADKLVLFIMTIGSALDQRVSHYNQTGKMSYVFALDAAGTAFIDKGARSVLSNLEKSYNHKGLKTTFPMGPGHSYWKQLEDMQVLFHYLETEKIGVCLTESNLMMPRKSVALVMGVGYDIPDYHGKTHCDFCNFKNNCNLKN